MRSRPSQAAPSRLRLLRGVVDLLGDTYAQFSNGIHEFHRAVADKPFKVLNAAPAIGTATTPVRVLHDGITDAVYTGVKEIGALSFSVAGAAPKLIAIRRGVCGERVWQCGSDPGVAVQYKKNKMK